MTVWSQTVQIATADGNDAVISAGLRPGMLVASAGVHLLSPDQKVGIYQQKVAVAPANTSQTAVNPAANEAAAVRLAAPQSAGSADAQAAAK